MSALATGVVVFACVFGGALLGILLRRVVPADHLSADSRDSVKFGMGLLATMAALVLGLLIASAKGSYDSQSTELTQLAANVALLDRMLAHYGPETRDAREMLRMALARMIEDTGSVTAASASPMNPRTAGAETFYDKIQSLSPNTDDQRALRLEAVKLATDLGRTRWLLFVQGGPSIPLPFLAMLIFWITVIFVSFGLVAPTNGTVVATLFICALSMAGAIFLIMELDEPFHGVIQVSRAQLRTALANLGY